MIRIMFLMMISFFCFCCEECLVWLVVLICCGFVILGKLVFVGLGEEFLVFRLFLILNFVLWVEIVGEIGYFVVFGGWVCVKWFLFLRSFCGMILRLGCFVNSLFFLMFYELLLVFILVLVMVMFELMLMNYYWKKNLEEEGFGIY